MPELVEGIPYKDQNHEVANSRSKEIVLGLLTVAAGLANAYAWKGVIGAGNFNQVWLYSVPVVLLVVFAVLFLFSSSFINSYGMRSGTTILSLAANYLLIPYTGAVLSALAITSAGAWFAAESIHKEARTANYFSARKILSAGIPVFFTALSLVFAVFYYSETQNREGGFLLPKALFDHVIPLLEKPLGGVLPGFKASSSVDDILISMVLRGSDVKDSSELPVSEKQELLKKAREALTEQLGISLTGKEKSSDLLYLVTNAQISKFFGGYQEYLPVIAAAGFFIAVRTFAIPVYWLMLIIAPVAVKLLLLTGFLKKQTEAIQITRITL